MTPDERRALAQKILCELSKRKTRATYGAVACILGVQPFGVGTYLGKRCHKASWVVSKRTGEPTGYKKCEIHPPSVLQPPRHRGLRRTAAVARPAARERAPARLRQLLGQLRST